MARKKRNTESESEPEAEQAVGEMKLRAILDRRAKMGNLVSGAFFLSKEKEEMTATLEFEHCTCSGVLHRSSGKSNVSAQKAEAPLLLYLPLRIAGLVNLDILFVLLLIFTW